MASSVVDGSRKGSPRKYDDIQCAKTSKQYPLLALNCHDGVSSSDGFTNGKNAHHGAVYGKVPLEKVLGGDETAVDGRGGQV